MFPVLHNLFELCCKKSTVCPFGRVGWFFASSSFFTVVCLLLTCNTAVGQLVDSFDSGRPRFQLWRDDANAKLVHPPKSEVGLEEMQVSFSNGSYVHLIYPIEPCAVIDELSASLRIRCAHSGLRIALRVVFPRSAHPATHDPLTTLLYGTPIEGGGGWSTSSVTRTVALLEEQKRFLRKQFGPTVDLRDPYVNGIVLDAYAWPGTTTLQVDDLLVEGVVAPAFAIDGATEFSPQSENSPPLTLHEQLKNLQASVPRWIQYQGESLDYLQTLGFNAVVANNANDPLLVEQSGRTGMGVIAPPPELVPTAEQQAQYKHVSGWLLGLALNESHLELTRNRVSKVTRFPQYAARPMIGEAMELYGSYSRLSDWLAVPAPLPTTVRSSREASAIMQSELRPMAGRSQPLVSIATQMPTDWIAQRSTATQLIGQENWLLPDFDLLQTRLQMYRSMMQGARGWIFRSSTPLDAGDLTASIRAKSYTTLNKEIDLLMPWIQAGQSSWKNIALDSSNYTAAMLETPKSQLVLIVAAGPNDQICSVAPNPTQLQFTLPVSGQPRRVFRITHGQLEPIRMQSTTSGMMGVIQQPALVEQIVSVADNAPIEYLEKLSRLAPDFTESRLDIAEQVIQIAEMSLIAQQLPNSHSSWEAVNRAKSTLRSAVLLLSRSDFPNALIGIDRATVQAQQVVRTSWEQAAGQFPSFQSSPLIASPLSLPLHWEFDRILNGRPWQSIRIPGVPFTTQEAFHQSHWTIDRRLTDSVSTTTQITTQVGPSGTPTLLLTTSPTGNQPIATGYAGAAMRVSSPTIDVPRGSMIHIEGLVQIASLPDESQSGLLISDNQGGEALGQLISSSDASTATWRRFSLYRFVSNPGGVQIYFETRGKLQAAVCDLTMQMIMPVASRSIPISIIDEAQTPTSQEPR